MAETGRVIGSESNPATGGRIVGSGQIDNNGVIALTNVSNPGRVKGNNFPVSLEAPSGGTLPDGAPSQVRVFAPTFKEGSRTLPTPAPWHQWNTQSDALGKAVSENSELAQLAGTGGAVTLFHVPTRIVTTWADLLHNTGNSGDYCGSTTVLGSNIQNGSSRSVLPVECDITIDLNGRTLTTATVDIAADTHLTITDTSTKGTAGHLDAQGSDGSPGIRNAGAEVTVDGRAKVTANGGEDGAGIGGGAMQGGGTTTIAGTAHVTAAGDGNGAGIGGGEFGIGGTTAISGSAVVEAHGGARGAGIGGGLRRDGGRTDITEHATVTAIGGSRGPGIGSGGYYDGVNTSRTTISGAEVTARGGVLSAGIGGGTLGNGGVTIIESGAKVTAEGGAHAAGIGGGDFGAGGTLTVAQGATLSAIAGYESPSAVGAGLGSSTDGKVTLNGTLVIPQYNLSVLTGSTFTVGETGLIAGPDGDRTGETALVGITGDGTITNNGVIALTDVADTVSVTGNNYAVTFETIDEEIAYSVTVYAPEFEGSYREFTAATDGYEWNTGDTGRLNVVTQNTPLTDVAESGTVTLYEVLPVVYTETTLTVSEPIRGAEGPVTGEPLTLTATVTPTELDITPAGKVRFTATSPTDVVTELGEVTVDSNGKAILTGVSFDAGTHMLQATYDAGTVRYEGSQSDSVELEVDRAPVVVVTKAEPNDDTVAYAESFDITATFYATIDSDTCTDELGSTLCPQILAGQATLNGGTAIDLDETGTATFTIDSKNTGSYTATVAYVANSLYLEGSDTVAYDIAKAESTVTASVHPAPVSADESFTVDIDVAVEGSSDATVTGDVELRLGDETGELLAEGTLSEDAGENGSVSLNATIGTDGEHKIVAIYLGDDNVKTSTSEPAALTVTPPRTVITWEQLLRNTTDRCDAEGAVILGADITQTATLPIDCDLTLDLNGHTLTTRTVDIVVDTHLTITDTSSEGTAGHLDATGTKNNPGIRNSDAEITIEGRAQVTAVGGHAGAGIGGGYMEDGGRTTIAGTAHVTASGGDYGAGIGGGRWDRDDDNVTAGGAGGVTTITDEAVVIANGGMSAAGIGGGEYGVGGTTTISGSADVEARGGTSGAGIGGGMWRDGGQTDIAEDATVTAVGGDQSPGIGSGGFYNKENTSQTTISGAQVIATGGIRAAGIGGGSNGDGGVTIIEHGAIVTATGGEDAAGVGGGSWGSGGTVTVAQGATLNALAGPVSVPIETWPGEPLDPSPPASAVGAGSKGSPSGGEATIHGTLNILRANLIVSADSTFVVSETGLIAGPDGDRTGETALVGITGDGTITNNGVIALTGVADTVSITGNNYDVTFKTIDELDAHSVTVYAPEFEGSYREFTAATEDYEWNTGDTGRQDVVTENTLLTDVAESGTVTLYEVLPVVYTDTTLMVSEPIRSTEGPVTGEPLTLTATVTPTPASLDITPAGTVKFTATSPTDDVTELGEATVDSNGIATLTGVSFDSGTHTLQAIYEAGTVRYEGSQSDSVELEVDQAPVVVVAAAEPNDRTVAYTEPFKVNATFYAAIDPDTCTDDLGSTLCPQILAGQATLDGGTAVDLDETGTATFTIDSKDTGSYTATVAYVANSHYLDGSNTVAYDIAKADSTVTAALHPAPVSADESFTVDIDVAVEGSADATVTGDVELRLGDATGELLAEGTLDENGSVSLNATIDTDGEHEIVAVYLGDDNVKTSTSEPATLTVTPPRTVITWGQLLRNTTDRCDAEGAVILGADITQTATLPIDCDLTLDLNGHTLTTATVDIATDTHLTITDTSTEGTVGQLHATGVSDAPGIHTTNAQLTVAGTAHVTALGGLNAAGIGGGKSEGGGTVTIGADAQVTASAGHASASAIGGGSGSLTDGDVTLNGTLVIPQHNLRVLADSTFAIGKTGLVAGPDGDRTGETAQVGITGTGTIINNGVIALTDVADTVSVTGNNYTVTFETQDEADTHSLIVYAPEFEGSFRDFTPATEDYEWNTSSTQWVRTVTQDTALADIATDGAVTIHEIWAFTTTAIHLEVSESPHDDGPVTGEPITLTASILPSHLDVTPSGSVRYTVQHSSSELPIVYNVDVNSDGAASLSGLSFNPGEVTIAVEYQSDSTRYVDSERHTSVTVSRAPVVVVTEAEPNDHTVAYTEPFKVTATFYAAIDPDACTDEPGSALCPQILAGQASLDGGTAIDLDETGTATFTRDGTSTGSYTATVAYVENSLYLDGNDTVAYDIAKADSTVTANVHPALVSADESFTVDIEVAVDGSSDATVTGDVELRLGDETGELLAEGTLSEDAGENGSVSLNATIDTDGEHEVVAVYLGDDNVKTSTSEPVTLTVTPPRTVITWEQLLRNTTDRCDAAGAVILGADITQTATLPIECDLTLDLNGHTLTTATVDIAADTHLTVIDHNADEPGALIVNTSPEESAILLTDASFTISEGVTVTVSHLVASGAVTIAGELRVDGAELDVPSGANVEVQATGLITGPNCGGTCGGGITGEGTVTNHGVIALRDVAPETTVLGNNYLVSFTDEDNAMTEVHAYGPSFATAYREFPTAGVGNLWNAASDGSGEWLFAETSLTDAASDGRVEVWAVPDRVGVPVELVIEPLGSNGLTAEQGGSLEFLISGTDTHGGDADTSEVILSSSVPTDVVDGTTVTFPTASPHVITATFGDLSTSVTVWVTPTPSSDGSGSLSQTGSNAYGIGIALALLLIGAGVLTLPRLQRRS